MKGRVLTDERVTAFERHLRREEKSQNTIQKYLRDVRRFALFAKGAEVEKQTAIAYKERLLHSNYAARSVNSMLASVNSLFLFLGWHDCRVKTVKLQRQAYCSEEKSLSREEYARLCRAAQQKRNQRLNLLLQTLCGTGIRVSELSYITVEAARRGEATVSLKGKVRRVFLVKDLQKKLLRYAAQHGIQAGPIFVTRTGRPISRTSVWREMKGLCRQAGLNPQKVFPHNLRHLFARTFYGLEKDLAKLADLLGHSSIETTRIYIISTGAEHRRRMEGMRLIL